MPSDPLSGAPNLSNASDVQFDCMNSRPDDVDYYHRQSTSLFHHMDGQLKRHRRKQKKRGTIPRSFLDLEM